MGEGTKEPVLVHLKSGENKCSTYALRGLDTVDTRVSFHEDILNTCEGFHLENGEVDVYIETPEAGGNSVGIKYIQLYNSRTRWSPFITCQLPRYFQRVEREKVGPFTCKVPQNYRLQKVMLSVCDVVHGGTDSTIKMEICSGGNCSKSILDSNNNDFERGDWMEYGPEILKNCTNFKVSCQF